jgi:hypothetical protein
MIGELFLNNTNFLNIFGSNMRFQKIQFCYSFGDRRMAARPGSIVLFLKTSKRAHALHREKLLLGTDPSRRSRAVHSGSSNSFWLL